MADITGTRASETLTGGVGSDTIKGLGGNDWLFGVDSNDSLYGGEGNDRLWGGDGNDRLNVGAGSGEQWLLGGGGNDTLIGVSATGALRMFGGQGSDTFAVGAVLVSGSVFLDGGSSGEDTFIGSGLTADLFLQISDDELTAGGTAFQFSGFETIYCGQGNDTVLAQGTNQILEVYGGGGNDMISTSVNGFVTAYGGAGDDEIRYFSVAADDTDDLGIASMYGGAGNDTLRIMEPIAVDVRLGSGVLLEETDSVQANLIATSFRNVTGNAGHDTLSGNRWGNVLIGNGGDDSLAGSDGADDLQGGTGLDSLYGGSGADLIAGGSSADLLKGGSGADTMTGGGGADMFAFTTAGDSGSGVAQDVITDFVSGTDKINLLALPGLTFVGTAAFSGDGPEVRYVIADGNTSVRVDLDGSGAGDLFILLQGVAGGIVAGDLIL